MSRFPFATELELRRWLKDHGIEHLLRQSVDVLAPRVDSALWSELLAVARRPLTDLATRETLPRWRHSVPLVSSLREALPPIAWQLFEEEAVAAAEARAQVAELLLPPANPKLLELHGLLVALRNKMPAFLAPRRHAKLRPELLRHDPTLPGLRFAEERGIGPYEIAGSLTLTGPSPKAECNCGAPYCVHRLAAIDAALLWLHAPERWEGTSAETLRELTRPAWERALAALEQAFSENAAPSTELDLSWRLQVVDEEFSQGVLVTPYMHQRSKKGVRSAGTRVARAKLQAELAARLSSHDARLVALMPDSDRFASLTLLQELIGHPQVFLEDAPDEVVHIERTKVGLVAEDRSGAVVVAAGIDGNALPPRLSERLRTARPQEALYLWDRGARRLTLLDVSSDMRAMLAVLARHGNMFPPESHGALVEKLSGLATRLPVAMPRSILGEAVPLDPRWVVRIEAQPDRTVRVELRVRPLPESGALVPGLGVRDVHVRRGEVAVHAVRELAQERAAAEALAQALPMSLADRDDRMPYAFELPDLEAALTVLAACEAMMPPPELEWVSAPMRIVPSQGPSALKVSLERRRSWFGVLGGLTVGGERVELARLLDAARRKERFVNVTGQTYMEIGQSLREQLEKLADHAYSTNKGIELGPSAVETVLALTASGAEVKADKRWTEMVERIAASRELKPRVPASLKTDLRPYQQEGFNWLTRLAAWGAGGVLADDMGLGKTVQALAVLLDRKKRGPQLVLAPTSVAFNWIDEAQRFAPSLSFHLFADADDREDALRKLGPGDVVVASYGLLAREAELFASKRFATIVFDEAQILKNATTHRAKAARLLDGEFKFVLSGTPLENHLGELWSVFSIVFPELLGSWAGFRERFAAPIEKRIDPGAAPALARVLQPFLLRRTKNQVEAQLPPRTDLRVPVVLSPAEWTLYEDARLAALSDLETSRGKMRDQERRIQVLAALTRLRLLASHPRLYDPTSKLYSAKLERFMELVRELNAEGQRTLVFSQFTSHLSLVREVLDREGIAYEYLDGSTPQAERGERVRSFQNGTAPLFLISLKAGGFGLNLTAASNVIHLDPWWNPAVEDQASDRAHRIGQDKPVTVYRLVSRGTLEEQILSLHEAKRSLVADVLEGKDEAGRLSTTELLGLLSRGAAPPSASIA